MMSRNLILTQQGIWKGRMLMCERILLCDWLTHFVLPHLQQCTMYADKMQYEQDEWEERKARSDQWFAEWTVGLFSSQLECTATVQKSIGSIVCMCLSVCRRPALMQLCCLYTSPCGASLPFMVPKHDQAPCLPCIHIKEKLYDGSERNRNRKSVCVCVRTDEGEATMAAEN